jgi:tetratricopeptide (TPR) repeat protein
MAVGMDLSLTSFLSLQSGMLLKTGKPRITAGTKLELEKFALGVNYTLDLATQFKPVDRIVLSLSLNLGDFGRTTIRDKVQELYLNGLAAYSQGEYSRALSFWEECLTLDKEFTPAQEMIDTTKRSIELEKTMKEKQTVE